MFYANANTKVIIYLKCYIENIDISVLCILLQYFSKEQHPC